MHHHHSLFVIYLVWACTLGGIFVLLILLFTMTPLSRLIARPDRHSLDD